MALFTAIIVITISIIEVIIKTIDCAFLSCRCKAYAE